MNDGRYNGLKRRINPHQASLRRIVGEYALLVIFHLHPSGFKRLYELQ